MRRNNVIKEVQRRLNLIKTANGYAFDIANVFRNPDEEPLPDLMPMSNIFELPEKTSKVKIHRGPKILPVYEKELTLIVEHWYLSDKIPETSRDINIFLREVRKVLFSDGSELGGIVNALVEQEVSRVFRPKVGNPMVGVGQVLTASYLEDFSKL